METDISFGPKDEISKTFVLAVARNYRSSSKYTNLKFGESGPKTTSGSRSRSSNDPIVLAKEQRNWLKVKGRQSH